MPSLPKRSSLRASSDARVTASTAAAPSVERDFAAAVIPIFTDAAQMLGLPKSYGEIYGLLFASVDPLTFSEIHARLDISKGSVSQGLKALRTVGAVQVDATEADGRERFRPELELRKLVTAFLKGSVEPQLATTAGRLKNASQVLNAGRASRHAADDQVLQDRLVKLKSWQSKSAGLMPWIVRFIK